MIWAVDHDRECRATSRQLPDGSSFLQLPASHRVELLRLRSADRVEVVAATAVEKRLTVKKIRDVVRKEREKTKSSRGRKPTPSLLRALNGCVRALRDESTGRLAFKRDDIGSRNIASSPWARSRSSYAR